MATKKVFVAGFGGQGVLLIGQMLAYAAMYEGKEATWMPSYGPEMRGGTANCTVCISDKPIASPLVTACDVLVAMNGPSLDKFEDMLVPGGHLFVNASVIIIRPAARMYMFTMWIAPTLPSTKLATAKPPIWSCWALSSVLPA